MSRRRSAALKVVPEVVPLRLDLGCGQRKEEGWTRVDQSPLVTPDTRLDLEKAPWPWADGAVDEARMIHVLEHITDIATVANELHRVLKVGGTCTVISPYYSSVRAWQDPTHVRAISEVFFLYWNKGWRESQQLDHYPITADFDFTYGYVFTPEWASRAQEARDFAVRHYINVIADIQVTLTKRGG